MADKKRAQKVSHLDSRRIAEPNERFSRAIGGRLGDKRIINRVLAGRKMKPCGRECREYGYFIAQHFNHGSFENFTELMNDEEFILEIAKITPNPTECDNYFYQYVNPYLKRKSEFRIAFLKAVYLNENVYKLEDINLIVEWCGLDKDNEIVLRDKAFKREFERRMEGISYQDMIEYNCSGEDQKELHEYKVRANELKVLCENMKKGLKEIYNTFEGEKKSFDDEPDDFWQFLCVQTFQK